MNHYNWDNLNVGNYNLNHSENFFAFKHSKHEKFGLVPENETMMDEEDVKQHHNGILNDQSPQDPLDFNSDAISGGVKFSKEEHAESLKLVTKPLNEKNDQVSQKLEIMDSPEEAKVSIEKKSSKFIKYKESDKENDDGNVIKRRLQIQSDDKGIETSKNSIKNLEFCKNINCEADTNRLNSKKTKSPNSKAKPVVNILQEPLKFSSKIPTQNKENIPNVIKYVEIYKKKKQNILQKQMEDDQKNRIFHSRPAPNFNISNEIVLKKRYIETKITQPLTPRVLKNSVKVMERARKLENLKKKSPKKYHAREPKVLNESPFVPIKENHILEIQPFNLHLEKRLNKRKCFDENIQKKMEEKKRKEEEERIRRDEELSREFRKMTTFKARPNPFNNH